MLANQTSKKVLPQSEELDLDNPLVLLHSSKNYFSPSYRRGCIVYPCRADSLSGPSIYCSIGDLFAVPIKVNVGVDAVYLADLVALKGGLSFEVGHNLEVKFFCKGQQIDNPIPELLNLYNLSKTPESLRPFFVRSKAVGFKPFEVQGPLVSDSLTQVHSVLDCLPLIFGQLNQNEFRATSELPSLWQNREIKNLETLEPDEFVNRVTQGSQSLDSKPVFYDVYRIRISQELHDLVSVWVARPAPFFQGVFLVEVKSFRLGSLNEWISQQIPCRQAIINLGAEIYFSPVEPGWFVIDFEKALVDIVDDPKLIAKKLAQELPPNFDFLSTTLSLGYEKYSVNFKLSRGQGKEIEVFSDPGGRLLVKRINHDDLKAGGLSDAGRDSQLAPSELTQKADANQLVLQFDIMRFGGMSFLPKQLDALYWLRNQCIKGFLGSHC